MELYDTAIGILLAAVVLVSAVMLMRAFVVSLSGNERRARRIVKVCLAGATVYGAILLVASMLPRTSVLKTELPYCDDDLCMTVLNLSRTPARDNIRTRFAIRLSSRANRGTRSAKGVAVYLTDERGRRFPLMDASPVPFDVDVEPHQALDTALTFAVPSDARKLYFEVRRDRRTFATFMISGGNPWQPLLKLAIE